MPRHVRGTLFADYVRMIRRRKDIDWMIQLPAEDLGHVLSQIEPERWYPMETFERLGNAILSRIANGDLESVRLWGRLSAGPLHDLHPEMVVPGDPMESLRRFKLLRSTFFDFEALEMPFLTSDRAEIVIRYHMGPMAEEAASFQTMGFCEGLLALADAAHVRASFAERVWAGDARTLLVLGWRKG